MFLKVTNSCTSYSPIIHHPTLMGVGMVNHETKWKSNPHRHKINTELVFVARGSGVLLHEKNIYPIEKGSLLAYNPGQQHCEDFSDSLIQPLLYHCVFSMLGMHGLPIGDILPVNAPAAMDTGELSDNILDCFKVLFRESIEQKLGYEQIIHSRLETLLLYTLRLYADYYPAMLMLDSNDTNLAIAVKSYIEQNYQQDIHLADLAIALSVSQYHLSHIFTSYYGVSPFQYLIMRRIDEAKRMLFGSQLLVKEIANRVGYDSVSNFSAQFKRQVGISPTRFREVQDQGEDDNPNRWMHYIR